MADFTNTRISERKYYRIEPITLMQNGGIKGEVYIASTYGFKVGQKVTLRSDSNQSREYKVKKVESETLLRVGPTSKNSTIVEYSDISDMTIADNSVIIMTEQNRPGLDSTEVISYVFEEEPAVALRTHQVDWLGRSYGENNPMSVKISDGNIDIGTVNAELEVQLSRQDSSPDAGDVHDSVRIGNQVLELGFNDLGNGTGEAKVQSRTHVQVDELNSTNIPLLIGGTFVGVWSQRTTPSMIMSSFSDKSFTFYAQFANTLQDTIDGNIDSSIPYSYVANQVNVPKRLVIAREYYRIVIVNTSGQNMSSLRFQTSIGDFHILSSKLNSSLTLDQDTLLTRSVLTGLNPFNMYTNISSTNTDSLHVSLRDGQLGSDSLITPDGMIATAQVIRLVGDNFNNGQTLLSHHWNIVNSNGGTASVIDTELVLQTNTAANGSSSIQTFRNARFISNTHNMSHQHIRCPNHANNNAIRRWGVYNPNDATRNGIYFENNSGNISIVRVRNSIIQETIPSNNFLGPFPFILDSTSHEYNIMYDTTGIHFFQDRLLVHSIHADGGALLGTSHLKTFISVQNTNGNTVNNVISSTSLVISRIGADASSPRYFYISGSTTTLIKSNPGRLHRFLLSDQGTGATSIVIYNNVVASGEIIAQIDTTDISNVIDLNIEFDVGLTIVTNAGATIKLTVVYD